MTLIGIAGPAGAGKDTFAEHLRAYGADVLHFADPLRDMLKQLGLTDEDFAPERKNLVIERFGKSPRQMLQTLGTEWGRQLVHPDLWVIEAKRRVERCEYMRPMHRLAGRSTAGIIVFADVRFPNEAAWIRAHGQLLHIVRPHMTKLDTDHCSENGIAHERNDVTVYNSGSVGDLADVAYALVERVVREREAA